MTMYLKRGDKIHLAVPIPNTFSPAEAEVETRRLYNFYVTEYGALGVGIVIFTTNSTLTHPVVVAVFREDTP